MNRIQRRREPAPPPAGTGETDQQRRADLLVIARVVAAIINGAPDAHIPTILIREYGVAPADAVRFAALATRQPRPEGGNPL